MIGALPHALTALQTLRPAATIDDGACTRAKGSGCQACVLACPQQAITLAGEHERPVVDPQACISCGVCVPACPTAAVGGVGTSPAQVVDTAVDHREGLTVRCGALADPEATPEGRQRLGVWCLAGLDPETVASAAAWLEPGARLELQHADCARCPVLAGAQVEELTTRAVALAGRLAPGREVVVRELVVPSERPSGPDDGAPASGRSRRRGLWLRRAHRPEATVTPVAVSRRALLFGGLREDPEPQESTGPTRPVTARPGAVTPPRSALLAAVEAPPLPRPYALAGCTACGACSAVCPTDALGWTTTGRAEVLHVDAEACIACNECVRVCPEDVLGLASTLGGDGRRRDLPQEVARVGHVGCDRCGAPLAAGEQGLCTRCRSRRGLLDDVWAKLDG